MKRILTFCISCLFVLQSLQSQQHVDFDFKIIDSLKIEYDISKYLINTGEFIIPDSHYISQIILNKGYSVYRRCDCKNNYVFPLNVSYNGSLYLMTFTYAGLYELFEKRIIKHPISDTQFKDYIMSQDTLVIDSLPKSLVGSANYQIIFPIDPEFTLFRTNKWLFLNFFFRMNESGLQYEYIGHEIQIPAVVLQLFSWGILVSDDCGGDNHNTIYIESYNYPDDISLEKPSDYSWIDNWMKLFKNKHVIDNYLFERTEWEMWNTEWWDNPDAADL